MANIDSKLNTIKNASSGEDVRDAIIGALRDINNDVPADMSNPKQKEYNMPPGSDLTVPINPPELISQIVVKQPNSGGKKTTCNDITITRNGEYPTDDEGYDPNEEIRYYNKVTVKVPQLANAIEMETVEITQNGLYSATEWNVDGLRSINVNVQGASGEGPFTVEFYNKPIGDTSGTVIETQIVALNGSAHCTALDGTTSGDKSFKGWDPAPVNVTRNMKCYPVYGDWQISPGEIFEDWSVICADRGAHYPIGAAKNLAMNVYANTDQVLAVVKRAHEGNWDDLIDSYYHPYINNQIVFTYNYLMVKVAEGEDGTGSTWISNGCASVPYTDNLGVSNKFIVTGTGFTYEETSDLFLNYYRGPYGNWSYGHMSDWEGSTIRQLLNGIVFENMDPGLKPNIKSVNKYSMGLTEQRPAGIRVQKTTLDKIWIPSAKELHSLLALSNGDVDAHVYPNTLSEMEEFNGIDYTANYGFVWPDGATTTNTGFITRTGIYRNSDNPKLSSSLRARWKYNTPDNTLILCSEGDGDPPAAARTRFPFGFCL